MIAEQDVSGKSSIVLKPEQYRTRSIHPDFQIRLLCRDRHIDSALELLPTAPIAQARIRACAVEAVTLRNRVLGGFLDSGDFSQPLQAQASASVGGVPLVRVVTEA
jgi:hypothetical protein